MDIATTAIRVILGIILVVFPVNALFIKAFQPKIPARAQLLMDAFRDSGYLLYFIQWTELIIGLALVTGLFAPLAALLLVPISLNIFLFHLFLAPPVAGPGLFILLMNAFLLWAYRDHYAALLIA